MNFLLADRVDDEDVVEGIFLSEIMRKHLTDREHIVLALRASGYTRSSIVQLLKLGKTTVYTCEVRALEKMRKAYVYEENL